MPNCLIVVLLFVFNVFTFGVHADIDWEDVTENIHQNPGAYELTAIGLGGTNANYRLALNGCDYFIRMAPSSSALLGADMEIEFAVLQAIASLHVSPQPIHLNKERRIMVTEYIRNEGAVNLLDSVTRQGVVSMLKEIDALNITIERSFHPYLKVLELVELAETLNNPVCSIVNDELLPALKQIDEVLSQIEKKALCHFDLHHDNILKKGDRLWIIDWEYATMSHPLLTFGSMASVENWSEEQMQACLEEYIPDATAEDYRILFLYRTAIDIYWAIWCHVQTGLSQLDAPYEEWGQSYMKEARKNICSWQYLQSINAIGR